MTDLTTIQSWPREQLESAFTQREVQLADMMAERDSCVAMATKDTAELKSQLGHCQAALYEDHSRLMKAEMILEDFGFRHCDIAACNCNGYHQQREEPEV